MGLWDSISGAFSDMGGWNTVGNIANIAGGAYDIYNSIQQSNLADKYAQLAFGTAAQQDAYAQAAWNRQQQLYWPLEDLNAQYMMEDLKALRPAYQRQVGYQSERMDQQLAQARDINPILDTTERSLIRKLVQGEDVLAERFMNQASTDVNTAFGQQRAQDTRAMGLAGVNPNSGQFANYMNQMGTAQALTSATARTQAARTAEDTALTRQASALNYAKGAQLPQYQTNPSDAAQYVAGLAPAGNAATGLANMYGGNAQNSMNGFWKHLSNLSGNEVNLYGTTGSLR